MTKGSYLGLWLVGLLCTASVNATSDPTAPWAVSKAPKVKIKKHVERAALPKLQSLVCGERDCQAIVDNQFVSKGDRIDGFRVLSITPSVVVIEKAARQWRLTVLNLPQGIKIG